VNRFFDSTNLPVSTGTQNKPFSQNLLIQEERKIGLYGRLMNNGKGKIRQAAAPEMLEKYYHIRGAVACDEGKLDQAIRFFRKAISIEDQPYTRAHLSLVYEKKSDNRRAITEITRAIESEPANAAYYLRRGALWQREGNRARSDEDYDTALRLDANCRRMTEIGEALQVIRKAFAVNETDQWIDVIEVSSRRLGSILRGTAAARGKRRQAVEYQSCPVRCPAYCCHFSKELFLHGVLLGPWKLQATRAFLKTNGAPERSFIARRTMSEQELRLHLVSPDVVVREEGRKKVFYPRRTDRCIGPEEAGTIPFDLNYNRLDWITEESKACAFLSEGRCMIHDLGGESALPACKEFLCLTGFIFLVLIHLDVISRDDITVLSMGESNRIAIEAGLLLAKRIYSHKGMMRLERDLHETLKGAAEADRRGESAKLPDLIGQVRRLQKRRSSSLSRQRSLLRKEIVGLMNKEVPGRIPAGSTTEGGRTG